MNPLKYQQKLVDDAKITNEEGRELIIKAYANGHKIVHHGFITGPYTQYDSYWLSDGTVVQMISPASLHWIEPLFLEGFF